MKRRVQQLMSGGSGLLVCALLLLGATPRAAHAVPGTEVCTFVATAPGVSSLPASRTLTISSASCTLTPPSMIYDLFCTPSEMVATPLGGSWEVTFFDAVSPDVGITVDDLSGVTMSPFSLCGLTVDVQLHSMETQSFSLDSGTGDLAGDSTDLIYSDIGGVFTAKAAKIGSYEGLISSFSGSTMTMSFTYTGTWLAFGRLPGLTPLGAGVLAAFLLGAGGFLQWRRRLRGA